MEVKVTGVDIAFEKLVMLLVKLTCAAVLAGIIVGVVILIPVILVRWILTGTVTGG